LELVVEIQQRLGRWLMEAHPEDAARVLAPIESGAVAELLADAGPDTAAKILRQLGPTRAAVVAEELDTAHLQAVLAVLPRPVAVGLLRRVTAEKRERLLDELPVKERQLWTSALYLGEKTAGALMDVGVLALPASLSVQEAIRRVEDNPERASYYLYAVDDESRLKGVVNLRELFLAARKQPISSIMQTSVETLSPRAGYHAIVAHPGWKRVHTLPVVDDGGRLLGAILYQTMRQIEQEVAAGGAETGATTAAALGDLFWTGIVGLVGAIGSGTQNRSHPR
jgi:magnesium transporter